MNITALNIILVRSKYSRNVGSVARVMGNLGAKQLYLVDPQCEMNLEARQGAAGSQRALQELKTYKSLDELKTNEPHGCYVSLTRRKGSTRGHYPVDQVMENLREFDIPDGPIYFVLGPEDHGLNTDEVRATHFSTFLPVFGEFHSYNLSHAALLTLYMAQSKIGLPGNYDKDQYENEGVAFPKTTVDKWCESVGYDLSKGLNASVKLTQMMMRAVPSPKEIEILESVLQQSIRKVGTKTANS